MFLKSQDAFEISDGLKYIFIDCKPRGAQRQKNQLQDTSTE